MPGVFRRPHFYRFHTPPVSNSLATLTLTQVIFAGTLASTATASSASVGLIKTPIDQYSYRWRNDDGSETTATWAAAEGADVSLAVDIPVRLRIVLDSQIASSIQYQLEYKLSTDTVWAAVPLTSAPITLSPSANITASGAPTTAQLTVPAGRTSGDFRAGRIQDDENPADAI